MAATEHANGQKATDAAAEAVPLSEAEQRQIRVLKAVVIGLGVLIVLGLGALLAAVILKGGGAVRGLPTGAAMTLPVPAGARVEEMRLSGNLLALRLRLSDGTWQVVVVDARRGQVLRRVVPKPTGD